MILVDTNLVVYATFAAMPEHERTRKWLDAALTGGEGTVGLCWPVLYAFARLATNPRVFGADALPIPEAWRAISALLGQPAARLVVAGTGHHAIATELAETPGLRSGDIPDLEIAALAIEHGLALATHDQGFRRFAALRVVDPIA